MSVLRSFRDKVLGSFGSDSHLSGAVVVADSDDTEPFDGVAYFGTDLRTLLVHDAELVAAAGNPLSTPGAIAVEAGHDGGGDGGGGEGDSGGGDGDRDRAVDVPSVLRFLASQLMSMRAFECEGLFRIPGSSSVIKECRDRLNRGDFNLVDETVDDVAGVMKLWLRSLPEPLMPEAHYYWCLENWERHDVIHRFLDTHVAPEERAVAVFVAKFLLEMARHEDKTLMSIDSLAVVFAPSFLRCPDTDPILMLQNTPKEVRFLKHLFDAVEEHQEDFGAAAIIPLTTLEALANNGEAIGDLDQAKLEKMLGRNARFGSSNKRRRRTPVPSVGRTKAQLAHLEAFRAELRSQKRASLVEDEEFLALIGKSEARRSMGDSSLGGERESPTPPANSDGVTPLGEGADGHGASPTPPDGEEDGASASPVPPPRNGADAAAMPRASRGYTRRVPHVPAAKATEPPAVPPPTSDRPQLSAAKHVYARRQPKAPAATSAATVSRKPDRSVDPFEIDPDAAVLETVRSVSAASSAGSGARVKNAAAQFETRAAKAASSTSAPRLPPKLGVSVAKLAAAGERRALPSAPRDASPPPPVPRVRVTSSTPMGDAASIDRMIFGGASASNNDGGGDDGGDDAVPTVVATTSDGDEFSALDAEQAALLAAAPASMGGAAYPEGEGDPATTNGADVFDNLTDVLKLTQDLEDKADTLETLRVKEVRKRRDSEASYESLLAGYRTRIQELTLKVETVESDHVAVVAAKDARIAELEAALAGRPQQQQQQQQATPAPSAQATADLADALAAALADAAAARDRVTALEQQMEEQAAEAGMRGHHQGRGGVGSSVDANRVLALEAEVARLTGLLDDSQQPASVVSPDSADPQPARRDSAEETAAAEDTTSQLRNRSMTAPSSTLDAAVAAARAGGPRSPLPADVNPTTVAGISRSRIKLFEKIAERERGAGPP